MELVVGNGLEPSAAPESFDVIAVTGSLPVYPESLEPLLANGGRMFVVVGEAPAMEAMLVGRDAEGEIWRENIFETVLQPLDSAPQADHFEF